MHWDKINTLSQNNSHYSKKMTRTANMKKKLILQSLFNGAGAKIVSVFYLLLYSDSTPYRSIIGRSWIQHPFSRDHQGIFGMIAPGVGASRAPSSLGSSLGTSFIQHCLGQMGSRQPRWLQPCVMGKSDGNQIF